METDLEAMIEASFAADNDDTSFDRENETRFSDSGVGVGSFSHSHSSNYISSSDNTTFQYQSGTSSGNQNSSSSSIRDIFYCQNYFDLNDILAQSQRLAVKFQRHIPKLGFLDPGSTQEEPDIDKGTKLELPLWVVKELNGDNVVSITLPKGYNQVYREILEADANCVNLHKLGPNFYRFGQHLASMNLPESEDIANSLIDTFTQRFHRLVNYALSGSNSGGSTSSSISGNNMTKSVSQRNNPMLDQNKSSSAGDDTLAEMIAYSSNLDNWEKELMAVGQRTARQLKRWHNRDITKVTANEMVVNLNKRKRLIEQHLQQRQQSSSAAGQNSQGLLAESGSSSRPGSPALSGSNSAFTKS